MQPSFRGQENEWRRNHREELSRLAGEWVVLEGETVIAHGPNPVMLVAMARAQGIRVPYVFYIDAAENVSRL